MKTLSPWCRAWLFEFGCVPNKTEMSVFGQYGNSRAFQVERDGLVLFSTHRTSAERLFNILLKCKFVLAKHFYNKCIAFSNLIYSFLLYRTTSIPLLIITSTASTRDLWNKSQITRMLCQGVVKLFIALVYIISSVTTF